MRIVSDELAKIRRRLAMAEMICTLIETGAFKTQSELETVLRSAFGCTWLSIDFDYALRVVLEEAAAAEHEAAGQALRCAACGRTLENVRGDDTTPVGRPNGGCVVDLSSVVCADCVLADSYATVRKVE